MLCSCRQESTHICFTVQSEQLLDMITRSHAHAHNMHVLIKKSALVFLSSIVGITEDTRNPFAVLAIVAPVEKLIAPQVKAHED